MSKLIKNILSLGIVQIANFVFPLITLPIISRIIGPEKFGVLNYAATFVSYFTLLIAYGFDLTATRRVAKANNDVGLRNKVFSDVFSTQLFLLVISIIIFIPCVIWSDPLSNDKRVAIFSFLICFSTLFTQNWMFQAMQDLSIVAILNFVGKLLGAISILLLVRKPEDYFWQALTVSLSSVVVAIISFTISIKKYHLRLNLIKFREIFQLLKNEKSVFISMVIISLYTTTNTVMLGILRPAVEVGYYTASQKLLGIVNTVINMPLAQSFFPFVGAAFGKGKENGIKTLQKISFVLIIAMFLATIVMFIFGPYIMTILYGDKFSPSIPVFRIVCFVPLIVAFSNIFGIQTMLNLNMDKPFFYITLGGAALGLCLNYIMIHLWGYIGTGVNWLVVEIYITLAMFLYLKKKGIYPISLKSFHLKQMRNNLVELINYVRKR